MAATKKYAGLPDLDAAPEIYETPSLADDVSTAPTGTVRTDSPTPSEENENLDRARLSPTAARARFEPAIVSARNANFSDSIAGDRHAYQTRSRRRRRRARDDGDSESEDETLGEKLARLKREAEELRIALERRDGEKKKTANTEKDGDEDDGQFEDSVETQADGGDLDKLDELDELGRVLAQLGPRAEGRNRATEDDFLHRLDARAKRRPGGTMTATKDAGKTDDGPQTAPSTTAAIATFADRLTAIESALGVTSSSSSRPVLPHLETLSTQITTLSAALSPPPSHGPGSGLPGPTFLDTVHSRLQQLLQESKRLTESRQAAMKSLAELHDKRLSQISSSSLPARRRGNSATSGTMPDDPDAAAATANKAAQIESAVFLEEQARKIDALYRVLPGIQQLQPLLPVVLERLRALSVVHVGAAEAEARLRDVESRQGEARDEIGEWRSAVEECERRIGEAEGVMKQNVQVLGKSVQRVEGRMDGLQKGST